MAVTNVYVFAFFTALVAVNLIFAEESSLQQNTFDFDQAVGEEVYREERSAEEANDEPQERLFFNLFNIYTTCNFTATGGATCESCTRAVRCFANNIGIARNCRGLLPYCNAGRCSFIPGTACNATG